MTSIQTDARLTATDIRRLKRHGYEILAVETRPTAQGEHDTIIWSRDDNLGLSERELPF